MERYIESSNYVLELLMQEDMQTQIYVDRNQKFRSGCVRGLAGKGAF